MYAIVVVDERGTANVGSVSGDDWLAMSQVPRVAWADKSGVKGFDLFMLFVWAIIYDLAAMYLLERSRDWYFNQIRQPYAVVRRREIGPANKKGPGGEGVVVDVDEDAQEEVDPDAWPKSLAVRDLRYTVPLKGGGAKFSVDALLGPCLAKLAGKEVTQANKSKKEIVLLNGVTARFRRGKMAALMGQSGAGKTTLMDVIAGYKTGGKITGDILIHGAPKEDNLWQRISGYAEQNDILNPYLSVLETLEFTTKCRLPPETDHDEVMSQVISLMHLEAYVNTVVGREKDGEGLPKHARKRVTIANELVTQPRILFLDEPTSGLGCNAAALVIGAVRRSTDALGLITLATIHQPSRKMFESFDDLLLLAKGGRVCWSGPMGVGSDAIFSHFGGIPGALPPLDSCNPADYVLDVVNKVGGDVAVPYYAKSVRSEEVMTDIRADIQIATEGVIGDGPEALPTSAEHTRTLFTEYGLLIKRHILCEWRNPSYSFMRMIFCFGASLFLGILFNGISNNIQGAVFSIAAIFFLVFVLVIPMQAAVIPLIEDRAVLYRETMGGMYSRLSYGFGQLAANIPFHIINTFLMFIAIYFLVGFRMEGNYVGYFLFMLFLSNWVVMSMGQLFALVTPNEESANGLAGLSIILSVCLMGFLITASSMPKGWIWAYWTNLFHYILQGLVTNQISGQSYHIDVGGIIDEALKNGNDNGNATGPSALVFGNDVVPDGTNIASQAANFMALALAAGAGAANNTSFNLTALSDLINCLVTNDCLVEPVTDNFVACTIFNLPDGAWIPKTPVCKDSFQQVTKNIDIMAVTECFLGGDDENSTSVYTDDPNVANGVPVDYTPSNYKALSNSSQIELVTCLVRAILPEDVQRGIKALLKLFQTLFDLVMTVIDVIDNGLSIPGDLILYYFGWAVFRDGEFVAPFKWHYCLTSVIIFLIFIEIFKLVGVRFFVWTKR